MNKKKVAGISVSNAKIFQKITVSFNVPFSFDKYSLTLSSADYLSVVVV